MDKSFPSSPATRVPLAIALAALAGSADSIGFLEHSQLDIPVFVSDVVCFPFNVGMHAFYVRKLLHQE